MRQSPTVRKRRLVAELKHMREAAGYTVDAARRELGWSSGRLNHMESGRSRPDSSALRDLMNTYGVTDPARREAVLALGRQSKERGWWDVYADVLPDTYIGFEAEAAVISTYQPIVIPGLLQTPDYTAAIARAALLRTSVEIERIVAVRKERQKLLARDDAPELRAVVDEAALLRLCRDPLLARQQIGHLIETAEALNTVTIRVLPIDAGIHSATFGAMVILDYADPLDPSIVYLETRAEGLYLEEPRQVAGYRQAFDHVAMDALSKAESIEFLKKAIE
ncbi:helix-turn-helix domain-containing protein [Actinorugispora endophytica]|uniref:Helix-turn-helix protein n=1 Tax=Actinorugispora endophytica TaxID=1605990 RepID=A0A4R6V847_9ACTN|nr:helix-turn-helix transcriptional regulator [Actinorugispora endophytica]TDQ55316.1 helix-turn-helix protein [Actinorugispora endophytica]